MSFIYHAFIQFKDRKGEERGAYEFNRPEEHVRRDIAKPYMENHAFMFAGVIMHPSRVLVIEIFKSKKDYRTLVLPNGTSPIDRARDMKGFRYVNNCFGLAKVEGVSVCTDKFITSPPKETDKLRKTPIKQSGEGDKAFIVYGKDEKQALLLQRYLKDKLDLDAEIFEDFKEESGSNTIIEQLEYIRNNVGYAFVIMTPDDLGCLKKDIEESKTKLLLGKRTIKVQATCELLGKLRTRARQNVVFEHGLFIGTLGRDKVCCLLQEDTEERPSDIDGVLYVGFKRSVKETFTEITQKLKKVGLGKA